MNSITAIRVTDVRFPTSLDADGSDAMNLDPDYSAAYLRVETSAGDHGTGFVFTIGRGNDIQVAALESIGSSLVGRDVEQLLASMGDTSRSLVEDSHLRWLGPEKGVAHMAIGGLLNALWDLKARRAGLPLWRLLAEMSPEEVVSLVDFRYISDLVTPEEALAILRAQEPTKKDRIAELLDSGFPAYTTSPGWLGYSDDKLVRLCKEAVAAGFPLIKLKVGLSLEDDIRRLTLAREACGPNFPVAVDANQRWGVEEAIQWIRALGQFNVAWVEEPTSPDDVVGHASIARAVSPTRIATGEQAANRIIFKQLLQLNGAQVVQIDATRVAGVNENIAILLMAAKTGTPVCPHAGGVGLCEAVQHLSMFDFIAVSGSRTGRMIEYVDHLHEHFIDPVRVVNGRYLAPGAAGAGTELRQESVNEYRFPDGPVWADRENWALVK